MRESILEVDWCTGHESISAAFISQSEMRNSRSWSLVKKRGSQLPFWHNTTWNKPAFRVASLKPRFSLGNHQYPSFQFDSPAPFFFFLCGGFRSGCSLWRRQAALSLSPASVIIIMNKYWNSTREHFGRFYKIKIFLLNFFIKKTCVMRVSSTANVVYYNVLKIQSIIQWIKALI